MMKITVFTVFVYTFFITAITAQTSATDSIPVANPTTDYFGENVFGLNGFENLNTDQEGIVKIKVELDSVGNVIAASFEKRGSTIFEEGLITKCVGEAKKAKLNPLANKERSNGIITFVLKKKE